MASNQTTKRIEILLNRYRANMESIDGSIDRLKMDRANLAGQIEALENVLAGEPVEKPEPREADPAMPSERDGD